MSIWFCVNEKNQLQLHFKYQNNINRYFLLLFFDIQNKFVFFTIQYFLCRITMNWIVYFTKFNNKFKNLIFFLNFDALKKTYNNQLNFFCKKLLQFCENLIAHLSKKNLSINEIAKMLTTSFEIHYDQFFQISNTQKMFYAFSFFVLYSENDCFTKNEIKKSVRKLWKQILFCKLNYFMMW